MKKVKLIYIVFFISSFSYTQNVFNYSGIVKDKNSNFPLEDALVVVKPLRIKTSGHFSGVNTNKNGFFDVQTSFALPLNILVSRKGCTSSSVKVKRLNETLEIFLECEQNTIQTIIYESNDDDGDGIINKDDKCPTEKGNIENNGCPLADDDNDGIPNEDDQCPNEKGYVENNGCPLDDDNDGIPNEDDRCPNDFGIKEFDGCPKEINHTILFKLDSNELSKDAISLLDILLSNELKSKSYKIDIYGHASNEGTLEYNQTLSEKRANTVSEYLIKKGINKSEIHSIGFGETKPIVINSNEINRSKNRRVEIQITIQKIN